MDDIPVYEEAETSPLTQVLKANHFKGWYKLSSLSNCAFYKLLSLGLTTHFTANFAGADYLRKLWERQVKGVKYVWEGYQTNEKFINPQFWTDMGSAIIEDLRMNFGSKQWFTEIAAGKIIDKNQKDIYASFLGYLGVALVWYELRSNGQVRALPFISASQGSPQVYITLATEGNMLYLLFHSSFNSAQYQEGYPFYTQSPTDPKITNVEGGIRPNDSEAKAECLRTQAAAITLLAEMLHTFGPKPLPLEAAAHQTHLKELIGTITQLAKACDCELKLNTPEMERVLTVQTAPDVFQQAVPQYHDYSNCESFPDFGYTVNHLGEVFHPQCLATYISQLQDAAASVLCPRCGKELPDDLVKAVAPQVFAERARRKIIVTVANRGATVQPPNYMSGPANVQGGASPGLAHGNFGPAHTIASSMFGNQQAPNQYPPQAPNPQPAFNQRHQASTPQPAYNQIPQVPGQLPVFGQMPQQGAAYSPGQSPLLANSPGQFSSPQPQQYSSGIGANQSSLCPLCQQHVLGNWFQYDCKGTACVMCAVRNSSGCCPFCNAWLSPNEQNGIAIAHSKTFSG